MCLYHDWKRETSAKNGENHKLNQRGRTGSIRREHKRGVRPGADPFVRPGEVATTSGTVFQFHPDLPQSSSRFPLGNGAREFSATEVGRVIGRVSVRGSVGHNGPPRDSALSWEGGGLDDEEQPVHKSSSSSPRTAERGRALFQVLLLSSIALSRQLIAGKSSKYIHHHRRLHL